MCATPAAVEPVGMDTTTRSVRRPDVADRAGAPAQAGTAARTSLADTPARGDGSDRPDRTAQADRSDRTARADRTARTARTDRADRTARAGRAGRAGRRPWRLGRRARKAVLLVHIVSAGAWFGVDVIVGALVLSGWFGADAGVRGVAYQALGMFVLWPMLGAGLVCLVSGVLLGLGSKYGLIRYTWVAVKLVLNVVLCVLILVLLRPTLNGLTGYGQDIAAGVAVPPHDRSGLFMPPTVSLVALSLASWLSVFKPWGRTRFGR